MLPGEPSAETIRCDGCGACCKYFPVLVSIGDAEREPEIVTSGMRLPPEHTTDEWEFQLFPLPFLETCAFLETDNRCRIYETRPAVCRRFEAGSDQCNEARIGHGLPRLGSGEPAVKK